MGHPVSDLFCCQSAPKRTNCPDDCRCELEEYHGYHRRYGNTAEKTFLVDVEEGENEKTSTPKALPFRNPPPRYTQYVL